MNVRTDSSVQAQQSTASGHVALFLQQIVVLLVLHHLLERGKVGTLLALPEALQNVNLLQHITGHEAKHFSHESKELVQLRVRQQVLVHGYIIVSSDAFIEILHYVFNTKFILRHSSICCALFLEAPT